MGTKGHCKINKYVHYDVRRNKLIAVYRKLFKHNIEESAYDDKGNCIFNVTLSCITVFSIISRRIIYKIEMNNIRFMAAFGGNKVLELDEKS